MAKPALQIGPIAFDGPVDAYDAEALGGIAGPAGARYDVLRIIQAHAAAYRDLTPLQNVPRDDARSENLDLEEIAEELDVDVDCVEGASVRGTGRNEDNRFVLYIVRPSPEARSTRGMLLYKDLPRSKAAYEEAKDLEERSALAARSSGGSEEKHGEDPRVKALQEKLKELQEDLKAERSQREEQAQAASGPPEPYEGYADANVGDVKTYLDSIDDPLEKEIAKRQVRNYEEAQEKPRAGVLSLTEPVPLVPAESD